MGHSSSTITQQNNEMNIYTSFFKKKKKSKYTINKSND